MSHFISAQHPGNEREYRQSQWHSQRFDQSCLHNETSIKSLHISWRDTQGSFLLVDTDLYPHCYNETAFVSIVLSATSVSHFSALWTEETEETLKFEASWPGLQVSGNPQICSCCQVKADLWRSFIFFCEVWPKSG